MNGWEFLDKNIVRIFSVIIVIIFASIFTNKEWLKHSSQNNKAIVKFISNNRNIIGLILLIIVLVIIITKKKKKEKDYV